MYRTLHCIQPILPVVIVRFLDILKEVSHLVDFGASSVSQHVSSLREINEGRIWQSSSKLHHCVVKVVRHRQVVVGGVELQDDLAVGCSL